MAWPIKGQLESVLGGVLPFMAEKKCKNFGAGGGRGKSSEQKRGRTSGCARGNVQIVKEGIKLWFLREGKRTSNRQGVKSKKTPAGVV